MPRLTELGTDIALSPRGEKGGARLTVVIKRPTNGNFRSVLPTCVEVESRWTSISF